AAVAEAEQMAGFEVAGVCAGIAGGHIRGVNSRGVVAVSGKDREVGPTDVERAVDAARAINLPQDREIIHVLPQNFIVDDGEGIRDPIGMSGVRLEVEVHIVTAAVTSVQNVVRSVNRAGLAVHDVILEPLASAEAVLYEDEKELGIVVVDLGGGTTDVALLRNGAIWHTAVLPIGGDHISNDIAIGLRTPMADAEDIKKRYGPTGYSRAAHPENSAPDRSPPSRPPPVPCARRRSGCPGTRSRQGAGRPPTRRWRSRSAGPRALAAHPSSRGTRPRCCRSSRCGCAPSPRPGPPRPCGRTSPARTRTGPRPARLPWFGRNPPVWGACTPSAGCTRGMRR